MGVLDKFNGVTQKTTNALQTRKEEKLEAKEVKRQAKLDNKQARLDYDEANKQLLAQMKPTGGLGKKHCWDDNLRIIFIKPYVIKYDKILSIRIDEKNSVVTQKAGKQKRKGVLTRAVVGTVLAPGVGTIIGGATAKKKTNSTSTTISKTEKTIFLTQDDLYFPVIQFPFNDATIIKLESIIAQNQAQRASALPPQNASVADEILKFEQLLDAGGITQEEFDSQKSKLLKL